jgi:hypothetical protein
MQCIPKDFMFQVESEHDAALGVVFRYQRGKLIGEHQLISGLDAPGVPGECMPTSIGSWLIEGDTNTGLATPSRQLSWDNLRVIGHQQIAGPQQ